jgi:hypothetical protein
MSILQSGTIAMNTNWGTSVPNYYPFYDPSNKKTLDVDFKRKSMEYELYLEQQRVTEQMRENIQRFPDEQVRLNPINGKIYNYTTYIHSCLDFKSSALREVFDMANYHWEKNMEVLEGDEETIAELKRKMEFIFKKEEPVSTNPWVIGYNDTFTYTAQTAGPLTIQTTI